MTDRRVLEAEHAAREARRNRVVRVVARSGYGGSAVLRLLIGVFALLLALHARGPHPDASGAFGSIARVPGGVVLLLLVAIGELALAAWLLLSGVLQHDRKAIERWRQRSIDWGRAVVFAVIGVTALRFAIGAGTDSARSDREASRFLLVAPGGVLVLALVGAVVLITGLSFVWIGAFRRFVRTIRLPEARGARRAVLALGVVGYVLQGATIAAVGVFLLLAALTLDPARAGLDGTLGAFADDPLGRVFLVVLGAGWIAAGGYAALRAGIARLG